MDLLQKHLPLEELLSEDSLLKQIISLMDSLLQKGSWVNMSQSILIFAGLLDIVIM